MSQAKEIDAGLGLVDRVVEQQKSAEFESQPSGRV